MNEAFDRQAKFVADAREEGYSGAEVQAFMDTKHAEARAEGYTDAEIAAHLGARPFNPAPVAKAGERARRWNPEQKPVANLKDALEAGWGMGSASLGAQALTGGFLPEKAVDAETPWYLRFAAGGAQLTNDVPAIAGGAALGGIPGAFALPMGMRYLFIDGLQNGEINTAGQFAEVTGKALWETAKGWITGQATMFGGAITKALLPAAAPRVVQAVAPTAAEIATMTATSKALEGHLPAPSDFLDAALVLGTVKGVHSTVVKLQEVYRHTGKTPQEVVADAIKDPKVWQDLQGDAPLPGAYRDLAESLPRPPTQAQLAKRFVPVESAEGKATMTPEMQAQAREFLERPFAEIPQGPNEPARPTHMNYNYLDTTADVKAAEARLSEIYEAKINEARGADRAEVRTAFRRSDGFVIAADAPNVPHARLIGKDGTVNEAGYPRSDLTDGFVDAKGRFYTRDEAANAFGARNTEELAEGGGAVSWVESHAEARSVLAELLGSTPERVGKFIAGEPASASTTAQLLARKELATGAAEQLMRLRASLAEKGDKATPEDIAQFLAQVERTSQIHASFLGERADVGRALNALKDTTRAADQSKAILEAIDTYGGPENVGKLVEMLGEYDSPAQAVKFARGATKATTWEKVVEAWRAGLVSGLRTHEVNAISNALFAAMRVPTQAVAAAYGRLHGGERVAFGEAAAMPLGMLMGIKDGLQQAYSILKIGADATPKAESKGPAIGGVVGEVVRLPFRALSAEDAIFNSINARGELYAQAVRKTLAEGKVYGEPAFIGRVQELVATPTEAMALAAEEAGTRYTFNAKLGEQGQSFQKMVTSWHLEWLFPFVRTPGNIFKETARMTPGLNFAVKQWREDYAAGGVARDKALAEVTVGAAVMSGVVAAVMAGTITGGGTPEPGRRSTDRAAGWKPYAVKIGNNYYDGYQRLAPYGMLMGLAADGAEFSAYMTQDEHDRWARMLGFAFAQNVTNQSYMRGMTTFVGMLQDPERNGESYFEALAGSAVPNLIGQMAVDNDPLIREIHGMTEAMRSRIPGMREGLMPRRDVFGEPISSPERLWYGSPFSVSAVSDDKVRTEASKIGFATPAWPKKLDVLPGMRAENLDKVQLTPEQRDVFASTAGQFAHQVLTPIVNGAAWDTLPPLLKRQYYEQAMAQGRQYGAQMALSGPEHEKAIRESVQKVRKALAQ